MCNFAAREAVSCKKPEASDLASDYINDKKKYGWTNECPPILRYLIKYLLN